MQAVAQDVDAVDGVWMALAQGQPLPVAELEAVAARLERVRVLGGRFARVGVGPEVSGMLKAIGRDKLVC